MHKILCITFCLCLASKWVIILLSVKKKKCQLDVTFVNFSMRMERLKGPDFWEKYSLELEDDDFRRYYRMDKSTLRSLTSFLNPVTRRYQGGRVQIAPHKCVGMTLFYMGCNLPYWQSAGIFGLSEQCFIKSTNYIMKLLNDRCKSVIKWPKKDEYERIAKEFNMKKRKQFPNVIGAIDGCHMRICAKESEKKAYFNFKQYHSIHLQAVCLADRKFTNIFVG